MSQACVKMAAEESVHALDRTGESQIISRNMWHRTSLCVNFRAIIYVFVCVRSRIYRAPLHRLRSFYSSASAAMTYYITNTSSLQIMLSL